MQLPRSKSPIRHYLRNQLLQFQHWLSWRKDEGREATELVVSKYFGQNHFADQWKFARRGDHSEIQRFSVPSFPHTMSNYLPPFTKAGLQIKEIQKHEPTEEAIQQVPRFHRWKSLSAFLLMVKATKPEIA
ncbi:hypothetical protein [Pseudovibrio sp. Ad5]|uniref:hypothetical protein n=1 Tax=Pseudovibrio sp. Ad5 TaxID=989436 RepID=UPI00128FD7B7|nr:hypothetical protein [Pseudovibrio sp. Ad5]